MIQELVMVTDELLCHGNYFTPAECRRCIHYSVVCRLIFIQILSSFLHLFFMCVYIVYDLYNNNSNLLYKQ